MPTPSCDDLSPDGPSSAVSMCAADIRGRELDCSRLDREFSRVAQFLTAFGIPGIGPDWFDRVGRSAWQRKNSRVYRVYEHGKQVVGLLSLAPIHPRCVDDLLAGRRSPWWDLTAADILDPTEHDRARFFGCNLFIEAYMRRDAATDQVMRWDLSRELRRTHLRLLLSHSSTPESFDDCQAIGMRRVLAGPLLPSGSQRWLWMAGADDFQPADPVRISHHPYLWYVFDEVRGRFSAPIQGLDLTVREQQVAYLFFCENQSREAIGELMGIAPGTVETHLKKIRKKAAELLRPVTGAESEDVDRTRWIGVLATYFSEHPGVLQAAGGLFGF